jgi:sulfur carrier protein
MTITVNGKEHDLAHGATGSDLTKELGIAASTTVAEVNGAIIPREKFTTLELKNGDIIELVTVVGGG